MASDQYKIGGQIKIDDVKEKLNAKQDKVKFIEQSAEVPSGPNISIALGSECKITIPANCFYFLNYKFDWHTSRPLLVGVTESQVLNENTGFRGIVDNFDISNTGSVEIPNIYISTISIPIIGHTNTELTLYPVVKTYADNGIIYMLIQGIYMLDS